MNIMEKELKDVPNAGPPSTIIDKLRVEWQEKREQDQKWLNTQMGLWKAELEKELKNVSKAGRDIDQLRDELTRLVPFVIPLNNFGSNTPDANQRISSCMQKQYVDNKFQTCGLAVLAMFLVIAIRK
jgi:hypothetical protein